jgi:NAD-dependent SIR2 family protein deacetylase
MQQIPLLPSVRIIVKLILGEAVVLLMLKGTSTLVAPIADLIFPCHIKNQRKPRIVILLSQRSYINEEAVKCQLRGSILFLRTGIMVPLKMAHMHRNMLQKIISCFY